MTVTSEQPRECFVYITLPGMTEPVTAGRFTLEADRHGTPLGRFVYGGRYLERPDAVALDPVELKLSRRAFETTALKGIFGALRDAGPDYWGRRVIERHAGKPQLGELDYLLYSPDDRAGALGFGLNREPPASKRNFNQTLDLEELQRVADAIMHDEPLPLDTANAQIKDLMLAGTSMGGARPKAVVEDQEGLWIAKFNCDEDRWNNARVEHAMLLLAAACGITTAKSRVISVGGRDVLLVKRFDREKTRTGYLRARMVSALTLLRTEDTHHSRDKWSYVFLAEELRRVCAKPKEDVAELFRRMCFNALISNIDDHPRNHAIVARYQEWELSPAYDLTPSVPVSLERRDLAMACGDLGRFACAPNLLSQSARFLLSPSDAASAMDAIERTIMDRWMPITRGAGVSDTDCARIVGAFAYAGFRSGGAST